MGIDGESCQALFASFGISFDLSIEIQQSLQTSIVVRSIDGFSERVDAPLAFEETASPEEMRAQAMKTLVRYIDTDTICYFQEYPQGLVDMQEKYWRPILDKIEQEFGPVKTTTGIMYILQSADLVAKLTQEVNKMSPLMFSAFEKAVLSSKSFMTGLALVKGWIDVEHAANAARVEILAQIQRWGEVEDTHDMDREEMKRQLGAASICARASM